MGEGYGSRLAAHSALCSQGDEASHTQHVLKDLLHSLCILQDEGMPLAILLGRQLVQFFPVHVQVAHSDSIDI